MSCKDIRKYYLEGTFVFNNGLAVGKINEKKNILNEKFSFRPSYRRTKWVCPCWGRTIKVSEEGNHLLYISLVPTSEQWRTINEEIGLTSGFSAEITEVLEGICISRPGTGTTRDGSPWYGQSKDPNLDYFPIHVFRNPTSLNYLN